MLAVLEEGARMQSNAGRASQETRGSRTEEATTRVRSRLGEHRRGEGGQSAGLSPGNTHVPLRTNQGRCLNVMNEQNGRQKEGGA